MGPQIVYDYLDAPLQCPCYPCLPTVHIFNQFPIRNYYLCWPARYTYVAPGAKLAQGLWQKKTHPKSVISGTFRTQGWVLGFILHWGGGLMCGPPQWASRILCRYQVALSACSQFHRWSGLRSLQPCPTYMFLRVPSVVARPTSASYRHHPPHTLT